MPDTTQYLPETWNNCVMAVYEKRDTPTIWCAVLSSCSPTPESVSQVPWLTHKARSTAEASPTWAFGETQGAHHPGA